MRKLLAVVGVGCLVFVAVGFVVCGIAFRNVGEAMQKSRAARVSREAEEAKERAAIEAAVEEQRRTNAARCKAMSRARQKRDAICLGILCPGNDPAAYFSAAQKKIAVGFDACLAKAAWGEPKDINRTIYSFGTHEQWVYGASQYVYIEDGKVSAIQQ
jgi:hypothetical protein